MGVCGVAQRRHNAPMQPEEGRQWCGTFGLLAAVARCETPKMAIRLFSSVEMVSGEVPPDRLMAELWHDEPPGRAMNGLQSYISRLRRVLATAEDAVTGAARIVTELPGWMLTTGPQSFDVPVVDRLVHLGRELRPIHTGADASWGSENDHESHSSRISAPPSRAKPTT